MTPALWGHLAMLGFSALVAGSFSLGALVANDIAPAAFNAVRFWIAAGVIGLGVALRGGLPVAARAGLWRYAVLGTLFAIYFVLMFEGLKTAAPVSLAAVFTLTPVMSGLFGWLLLRQITTGRMALALSLGAVGALWVIFRADWAAFRAFDVGRGELLFGIGCVSHAIYTPMVRKLNRGETALDFTFGTLLMGALLLTLWAAPDLWATPWADLPARVWVTLLYTAIFASAASFLLLQFATLRLPSAKVMAYTYLVPSWVILWELGLGRLAPPGLVLLGVGLTVGALLLLLRQEAD